MKVFYLAVSVLMIIAQNVAAMKVEQVTTLDDIANDARILKVMTISTSDEDAIKKKYMMLQQKVNTLNKAAIEAKGNGVFKEYGKEGCGDNYTEFIILLQNALSPIKEPQIANKLKRIIQ